MKAAGIHRPPLWGKLASLAIIAVAIAVAAYVLHRQSSLPSSDDATIDADVVHVASAVGGRIVEIPVAENVLVARGDLLFQIDPEPHRLAVAQAQADLELARATLDAQRRVLSTQRSTAVVATDQTKRAATDLEHATRTVERLRPLADKGYVPVQQLDQAQTAQRDAATSLRQAQEQQGAAARAVGTEEAAEATVRAREAALALARRALEDRGPRAPRRAGRRPERLDRRDDRSLADAVHAHQHQ